MYISDCTDNIILGILELDMCVSLHAACTQHLARGMPVDMLIREVCCANASQNLYTVSNAAASFSDSKSQHPQAALHELALAVIC